MLFMDILAWEHEKGQSCKKDSQWKCPEGIAPRIKDTERGAVLWYLIL